MTKHTEERTKTHACDCKTHGRTHACDCISRKELLKKQQIIIDEYGLEHKIVHIGKIIDAPSVEPERKTGEWISVSERLPEDIKPVIVTWKNNDPKSYYQYIVGKHFIGTAHFKNGKWFWYSSVTEDLLAEYGKCDSEEFDEAIEVIAWMPLPEPMKVGEENC